MIRNIILGVVSFAFLSLPIMASASISKSTKRQATSHQTYKVSLRKKVSYLNNSQYRLRAPYRAQQEEVMPEFDSDGSLRLGSTKALIVNQDTGEVLYAKNTGLSTPIASVTKLMTAMVMLDAQLDMNEFLSITEDDLDFLKGTGSRLRVGTQLTRAELLQLALMSSENRAASALGRNYPGGLHGFVNAMNAKAAMLGMGNSSFVDPTGLNSANKSTAEDLVRMVRAAYQYPEIRRVTTTSSQSLYVGGYTYPVNFKNTNALVREGEWSIGLSKTGYISEAGRCLVMQANVANQPVIIVLLDSDGKFTRIGDANRIRRWLEAHKTSTTLAYRG